jgi:hypothetical protein
MQTLKVSSFEICPLIALTFMECVPTLSEIDVANGSLHTTLVRDGIIKHVPFPSFFALHRVL